jgi:hypothetical protein
VQASAKPAQVGDHFLVGIEGLQMGNRVVGIRLIIEEYQFDRNLLVIGFDLNASSLIESATAIL